MLILLNLHFTSDVDIMNKEIIEAKEVVDFGLFYSAKEYYEAAKQLKGNRFLSNPYNVLLAFSIELFLKSIGTTIQWSGATAVKVKHAQGHKLCDVFKVVEKENPSSINYLKEQYSCKVGRDLFEDIALNSEVFTKRRYPYYRGGNIPLNVAKICDIPELKELKELKVTTVYVTQLEDVSDFLHDELIVHFGPLFENLF